MRVLIGEISSYKAIVIARYIRQYYPEIELLAYDNNPLLQYIHSRYVDDCTYILYTTLTEYIKKLADYVRNNNVDIFIPVHSDYIGTILQHKHLFGRSLDYQGTYSDYIRLHEKDQLMQLARSLHIRTPKEYTLLTDAPIPFVLKPTNLSSAKGIKYIKTDKDKINLSSIPKGLICQEYIQGQGCGYEVYCQNGHIVTEYGHLRLAEWPVTGGSSVLRTGYIHPDMRPIAEKILSNVSWTGFAMFEFKLTQDNQLVLIEVNPRIWGSINQALQNECPLFSAIFGEPKIKLKQSNIRTSLFPQVWLAMLLYTCKGKANILKDYLANYKITQSDINLLKDPLGIFSILIRKLL